MFDPEKFDAILAGRTDDESIMVCVLLAGGEIGKIKPNPVTRQRTLEVLDRIGGPVVDVVFLTGKCLYIPK